MGIKFSQSWSLRIECNFKKEINPLCWRPGYPFYRGIVETPKKIQSTRRHPKTEYPNQRPRCVYLVHKDCVDAFLNCDNQVQKCVMGCQQYLPGLQDFLDWVVMPDLLTGITAYRSWETIQRQSGDWGNENYYSIHLLTLLCLIFDMGNIGSRTMRQADSLIFLPCAKAFRDQFTVGNSAIA